MKADSQKYACILFHSDFAAVYEGMQAMIREIHVNGLHEINVRLKIRF